MIALYVYRARARKNSVLRDGNDTLVTLRVLVPKFRNEGDMKAEMTSQQIQEDISITETFFGALGGLKAQKGFGTWLRGRSDVFALEVVSAKKVITFYITIPRVHHEFAQQQLQAQYPDSQIEDVHSDGGYRWRIS